jgi:hypothetical protein
MRIVKRSEWGADPNSVGAFGKMPLGSVSEVNVHHTVTPSSEAPFAAMKRLESIGMSRFGVFSYSFAIHKDGTILEGTGWKWVGAHTGGRNSSSYGIVFIGNYETEQPTTKQIESFRWLISKGTQRGKRLLRGIHPGADIWPHQKWKATACPGRNVIAQLAALSEPFSPKVDVWCFVSKREVISPFFKTKTALYVWAGSPSPEAAIPIRWRLRHAWNAGQKIKVVQRSVEKDQVK